MPSSTDSFLKRVPPVSAEAEDWVISCLLLDPTLIGAIAEIVSVDDFYQERNKIVFSVMVELDGRGTAATLTSITDHLKEQGKLDFVGYTWIATIADSAITTAFYKDHANIIREKSLVRKILNLSLLTAEQCYDDHESVEGFLDEVESKMFQLSLVHSRRRTYGLEELLAGAVQKIDELRANKQHVTGVPSGLIGLDRILGGFQPTDLVIIGGRPGQGKSAASMGIALYAAIQKQIP